MDSWNDDGDALPAKNRPLVNNLAFGCDIVAREVEVLEEFGVSGGVS
jgi:hypothetical protein